jgi:hypothetical protein
MNQYHDLLERILKHFRAIATRYDKLARNFLAGLHLASAIILLTARRLVDFLEQDGFDLETAAWVLDDEGRGRLYLVPRERSAANWSK